MNAKELDELIANMDVMGVSPRPKRARSPSPMTLSKSKSKSPSPPRSVKKRKVAKEYRRGTRVSERKKKSVVKYNVPTQAAQQKLDKIKKETDKSEKEFNKLLKQLGGIKFEFGKLVRKIKKLSR